ncbi:autotransporter outer membrane beta-barrel domain-containing protein [Sutterella wadsworthensis]|uniref:autotransporter outer membrane beta-barrel domain-containing protein n=1 Tax=Sutterella wadsworthensis TaxID=40545 RepID=UPI002664E998|nr:autotransporter outer membrane beta-barrel domain-containing protein [Sutterella wadsworthensis]
MGKLSTTRLAFLAVAVAAAFPVLAQAADAATVDQGTLEKGFSQSTGGNSIFEDTNVALKLNNQVTVGTSLDTKGKIYLKGETDNISSLSIKSNSIHFGSNAEITASGSTINPGEGLNHFSAWQDGNSSLTIETNKLTIGDNEKSADRGFQMKGANNHLTILADEIVAYVGDGFINAQGTDGSSKVLIGTETNRIKQFEAHTTYGKDDYGVALLQANEGNTVSLYADEAILDGSRGPEGGVIGSGGWGTVIVDANKLTIDGNISAVNLTVNKTANITGTIIASQTDGTSTVTLGGAGDATASSGKYKAELGGSIVFKDSGSWVINEWEGTDGKLEASDSVKVDVNGAVQTASTTLNGTSTLTLNDGAKITSDKLDGSGGTFLINTADKQIINIDNYENTNAQAVLSGSQNDKYASADEAVKALEASVGSDTKLSLSAAEGAVADSWKVVDNGNGTTSLITQANQKLEGYNTINSLAVFSWRHELNNLQKRMGELRDLNGNIGAWARVFGSEQKYGDAGQVNKNTTIQIGADVKVADAWTIGGAFSYTDGSVEATSISGDNKAYAFTAYGVWQHENGSYLDLTARYARLDADFTAQTMTGSYNNNAYAVTAEVGHKFNLSELAFIEPQAEVIYGRVVGDDFTASNGTRFSQKDYDSLIGRLGARAGFNFPENKGNIYARFSVVHDFQGEVETTALNNTSRTVKDDLGGTWVEYGVGGNFRLSDTANVYVDLERTSGGEIQENWRWTIGARKVF